MDSVDYTKQLNRKNELFRRDIKKANQAHEESLESVKETAANRTQKQSAAYDKARTESEKSFKNTVSNMRTSQAESLREKNKEYQETVGQQKDEFHKLSRENIKDWDHKFKTLKGTFDKDINYQKEKVSKNDQALRTSFDAEKKEITKRHEDEKNDLLSSDLEKKQRMRDYTTNEVAKIKGNQEQSYIAGRELAASKFEKMNSDVNEKQAAFNENELDRVKDAASEGIADKNRAFAKRYADLDYAYNKDVRDIQRRVDAEKVTSGDTRKAYDEKLRTNEKNQHDQRREILLDQNVANTKFYNDKMSELKELQQDELHQERIRNADTMAKEKESNTLTIQERDFKSKTNQERSNHQSNLLLNTAVSENEIQRSRMENHQDTEINNLKASFKKGMDKAHIATQESLEEVKQDSVMEKRALEKRLRTQNSDNTTQLKNLHNTKYEIMKNDLETEILTLRNKSEAIQRGANDMVQNIRTQSAADLELQVAASEQKLNDLLVAERETSKIKENTLKKTLREAQSSFTKKMNEITHSNQIKLKTLTNTLVSEAKHDVAKQQEENQIQKRYFTREIERLNSSSSEEREALITQYEDRIKQMQQIYAEKLSEIKNFNKLENA